MDLSNLLSHWRMEENLGAVRTDAHGGNGLQTNGSPGVVAGKVGSWSADFNGTTQYLYNFGAIFHPGNVDWEINGWVKFDTLAANKPVIFGGGLAAKSYLLYTDGASLIFSVSVDGATYAASVTSAVALSTGVWYFFRCWHDAGNDQIGIKVNTEAQVTTSHSTGVFTDVFPNNYLTVAVRFDVVQRLDGQVDSLSFWTRVLSDIEGQCVYNSGTGLDYPWPCVTAGVPAISFFDAITRPTITPIVLAEVTVGIWCRAWVVDGTLTNSYKVSARREDARGASFALNITAVKWNLTTELTQQASAAAVNSNAGSWFSDGTDLWVRPVSGSIFDATVQAFATFYFSQNARVLNDKFWEPRLSSVPNLSQRIEATFGGVGQIGGGAIALFNHDGFFNDMQDFQWHHGTVTLRLGIDLPNQIMDWQDYQVIATWNVKGWRRDETQFTLGLIEPKAKVKTKLPFAFFDRATYPNIEDSVVGKPIPIAYGRLYGVEPILISPGAKTFKVAGHAIKSFDGVRIKTSREETRTITTAVGDWQPYSGAVYRYYLTGEEPVNVTFNAASLADQNSIADVLATTGSWGVEDNYIYVNPTSGETIASGVYAIAAKRTAETFITANFASLDAANGQFTMGADWAVGTDVSVDFRGKVDAGGVLIENPADIVLDLLTTVGETNVDAASFATAAAIFDIGLDENGGIVTRSRPSVYLEEASEVLEIIGRINDVAGCYLYSDELGRFHFGAFQPEPGESLSAYSDLDMLDFEEMTDADELPSKFVTKYQERKQDGYAQIDTFEELDSQYIAGQAQPVVEENTVELSETEDAMYWTRRQSLMRGFPKKLFTLHLPWNALLRRPGEQIKILSDARALDEVFEVLEVRRDLGNKQVTLVVGNLRNYADTPGFWVDDAALLPSRFQGLAGYGAGLLNWNSAWDAEIKKWARQNVGYWTDANGFAATADADSFLPSVWI